MKKILDDLAYPVLFVSSYIRKITKLMQATLEIIVSIHYGFSVDNAQISVVCQELKSDK